MREGVVGYVPIHCCDISQTSFHMVPLCLYRYSNKSPASNEMQYRASFATIGAHVSFLRQVLEGRDPPQHILWTRRA